MGRETFDLGCYDSPTLVIMVCKGRGGGGEPQNLDLKLTLTIFFENICEFHKTEIEEQGRDQALLSLTEKLLFIMDQLFHEASTTLSQDKYNEFSVSCEG
jgi:hypothetical protein